jgi:hypothetical protein
MLINCLSIPVQIHIVICNKAKKIGPSTNIMYVKYMDMIALDVIQSLNLRT